MLRLVWWFVRLITGHPRFHCKLESIFLGCNCGVLFVCGMLTSAKLTRLFSPLQLLVRTEIAKDQNKLFALFWRFSVCASNCKKMWRQSFIYHCRKMCILLKWFTTLNGTERCSDFNYLLKIATRSCELDHPACSFMGYKTSTDKKLWSLILTAGRNHNQV